MALTEYDAPAASADPLGQGAQAAAAHYTGQKVILIPEQHFSSDSSISFSQKLLAELKAKGVNSLGLELIGPSEGAFVQAFKGGRITRQEFLDANKPQAGMPQDGTPYGNIGTDRANALYETIADMIESGVDVYPLGTTHGMYAFTLTDESAEKMNSILAHGGAMMVDDIIFSRGLADWTDDTAKARFDAFYAGVEHGLDKLNQDQQTEITETMLKLREKEAEGPVSTADYKATALSLFHSQSPTHQIPDAVGEWLSEQLTGQIGKKFNIGDERRKADPSIAEAITQKIEQSGPTVVVYGSLHTSHVNDIDSNLRRRGVSPIIFDLEQGENLCRPPLSPSQCNDAKLADSWRRVASRQENDPGRFTVHIDGGTPKVEPLRPWTALDNFMQRLGFTP